MTSIDAFHFFSHRDQQEIDAIEAFSFPGAPNAFNTVKTTKKMKGDVARVGEKIVGYMVYDDDLNVNQMGVHPNWRRQTIGTQMIARLKSKMDATRNRIVIDLKNCATPEAIAFLDSQNFIHDDACTLPPEYIK